MSFDVVDLVQGTPEWLRWRHDGIGASDAATMLGENPFASPAALLAEKIAPLRGFALRPRPAVPVAPVVADLFGTAAPPRETGLEAQARRLYRQQHGSDVAPACLVSRSLPWQRASLDGIDLVLARALEIKCGPATHAEVARTGRVPGHYIAQLQQTLAVTGYDRIDFWVWRPGRPPLLITEWRDDVYIERLARIGADFWARVLAGRARLARTAGCG